MKFAPLVYNRGIAWTVIFGNHDEEETDLNHEKQMSELEPSHPLLAGL